MSRHLQLHIQCPHPDCGSFNTHVYCSRDKPVRYHRCRDCGRKFKSTPRPVKALPEDADEMKRGHAAG